MVKRYTPGFERNCDAILRVLDHSLRAPGTVLEIGAGTGQHAVYFAERMPSITWIPSEKDSGLVDSIGAWRADAGLPNLRAPLEIDATDQEWDAPPLTAIVAIDLTHVAPWAVTVGVVTGAARILPSGGELYLYGPFRRGAAPLSTALAELDAGLRRQAAHLGLRDLDEITTIAASRGLHGQTVHELPGDNLLAVFRR
jgi:hypothetical protein